MSDDWFNIRFGKRHLKIGGDKWWHVDICKNPYYDSAWPLIDICYLIILGKRII